MATQAPRPRRGAPGRARFDVSGADPAAGRLDGFVLAERPSVLEVMARRPFAIALATIATAGFAYAVAKLEEPRFRAMGRIFLVDPNREMGLDVQRPSYVDPRRGVRTRGEVALSGDVVREVARRSGRTPEDIRNRLSAEPVSEADILTMSATAPSAQEAARLVSLAQQAYARVVREIQQAPFRRALADLERIQADLTSELGTASPAERARVESQLDALDERQAQLRSNMALLSTGLQDFEEPLPPEAPVAPRPLRSAAVGAMLGFIASIALLWFWAARRATATRPDLAAPRLGVPVLVELPGKPNAWTKRPLDEVQDAYRRLAHVLHQRVPRRPIVVTAGQENDLDPALPLQISAAATELGLRPLVIEGDPFKGRRRTPRAGIWDVALGEAGKDAIREVQVGERQLAYLPSGSAAYERALASGGSTDVARLTRLFADFDPVVISGPVLESVVSSRLPQLPAETVAIVVVTPQTPLRGLQELRSRLDVLGLQLVGFVYDDHSKSLWETLKSRRRRR